MVYDVVLSATAERHVALILEDSLSPHPPAARLGYVERLLGVCLSLSAMPHRFAEIEIGGRRYRAVTHRAHRIFYRVDDDANRVVIAAILHGRMDHVRRLRHTRD